MSTLTFPCWVAIPLLIAAAFTLDTLLDQLLDWLTVHIKRQISLVTPKSFRDTWGTSSWSLFTKNLPTGSFELIGEEGPYYRYKNPDRPCDEFWIHFLGAPRNWSGRVRSAFRM